MLESTLVRDFTDRLEEATEKMGDLFLLDPTAHDKMLRLSSLSVMALTEFFRQFGLLDKSTTEEEIMALLSTALTHSTECFAPIIREKLNKVEVLDMDEAN